MAFQQIQLKRVYDQAQPDDGVRVLCTTHWPRGVKKAAVDRWCPELGTPPDLIRPWLDGQLEWAEFAQGVRASLQLTKARATIGELAVLVRLGQRITLLTSVKEMAKSHLPIVAEALCDSPPPPWLGGPIQPVVD